jgi:hypothetical protein
VAAGNENQERRSMALSPEQGSMPDPEQQHQFLLLSF